MAIEELNNLGTEFEQAKRAFTAKAQTLLEAAFKEYFEKHSEVTALRWSQYTPYFNDGDACVFSVGDMHIVKGSSVNSDTEDEDNDEDENEYVFSRNTEPYQVDASTIARFLSDHEDIAEAAYGDHVRVTVTRSGVEIDEYDHD